MKTSLKIAFALLAILAPWQGLLAQAQPAPAPAGASTAGNEEATVQLSPFEVNAGRDVGYQATETLAGTRIRTNLADVGSAIQVVTKEFMQDVGATNNATLLQYTTNAEVGGTLGIYEGAGNATAINETVNLINPQGNQRIRGLAAADNARDFFVTDIPWDSYIVDRIDIQRGPNQILFGLGSPAGIINGSIHNAEFADLGSVEVRTGSYGTFRSSVDLNQQLIPGVLAVRVDGLWNNQRYEQDQAWQNDRRVSGELRFDPQLFRRRDFHTSIRVKFENGDIKADRPRTVPPEDRITPWFRPIDATSLQGGMNRFSIINGYQIGAAAINFSPWIAQYANQQQPTWFIDGTSDQLYRIYGGFVNTGALSATGVPQGASTNLINMRYADAFSALSGYSTYAVNAHLPNSQYGQYRNVSLEDPSVFDFYHNLIDGPTANQFEKWNALNIDIQQTFWDDRLGVDFSYDRQRYKRGGQQLLGNPYINIDILQNFPDYAIGPTNASNSNVANPNYGRPWVNGGPGTGQSYESDRKNIRASLFGEVRSTDFLPKDSLLAKIIGHHRFNGVYADETYGVKNLGWNLYANSLAYASYKLQGNPDSFNNLAPIAVIYLGGPLSSQTLHPSAANAHIPAIGSNVTLQSGNIYQFDSTWRNPTGVNFSDPWTVPANLANTVASTNPAGPIPIFNGAPVINTTTGLPYAQLTQVSNPGNYVGWNSNFTDNLLTYNNGGDQSLTTSASQTRRETISYAGTWQGYMWNDSIVPTMGWRYDEVKNWDVTAGQQAGSVARGALNLDPNVYMLPVAPRSIFKAHSTSGGVVVHLNKLLGSHDFLPINISLSFDKSSNFQVVNARRDIYGNTIGNPTGETKEYGIALSTKDERFSFQVVKYETKASGVSVSGFDNSGIYGTIRDALNWRNIKTYYMSAYAWNTAGQTNLNHYTGQRYLWDAAYVDNTTGRPVASGALATGPANSHLETQAQADARRDAAIAALNGMQTFLAGAGYFTAWNYPPGPTLQADLKTRSQFEADLAANAAYISDPAFQASVYDYRNAPLEQGFAVTQDTDSKGYEFQLTANPTPNWRIQINAAKADATAANIGGANLDSVVSYMDTLMAGPAGDLVRFNSDYSAGNELRFEWNQWRGQYTLLKLGQGADVAELRPWHFNLVTNYMFDHGMLKGVGVGAAYRWADKVVIGYPVVPNPTNPLLATFDLNRPYFGPKDDALDLWVSYQRKLTNRVSWRIQLNVYNVGKKDGLIPISVEPDGHTWAGVRLSPVQQWSLTNTFSF